MAERLREKLASMALQDQGRNIKFTVSIGLTEINRFTAGLEGALSVADALMYKAKISGRNRVVADEGWGARASDERPSVALVQDNLPV